MEKCRELHENCISQLTSSEQLVSSIYLVCIDVWMWCRNLLGNNRF